VKWSVVSLNDEMSHRLRVSQVELHGFAVNAPVLLPLQPDLHPPVRGYVDL